MYGKGWNFPTPDVVFIDAGHTYENVTNDIENCIRYFDDFSINIHIVDEPKRDQYLFPISDFDQWTSKGLISFIIFSFTMGLFALLTPCVFPMIPITVSFFTKQGELENNNPLRSATIYVLGIIAIFTSLGLILSLILGGDAIVSEVYTDISSDAFYFTATTDGGNNWTVTNN